MMNFFPTPAPVPTVGVDTLFWVFLACMAIACLGVIAHSVYTMRRLQENAQRVATNGMLCAFTCVIVTMVTDMMHRETARSIKEQLMKCIKGTHETNADVNLHTALKQLISATNSGSSAGVTGGRKCRR